MKDTIALGTFAGAVATLVLNLLTFLARLVGIRTSTPWDVAALLFLNERYLGTGAGFIIGFFGSMALGIATGVVTSVLVKFTGSDYAMLKGVLAAEALGFAGISLFAPILGIAGFLKFEPASNFFALVGLFVFGLTAGYIIKKLQRVDEAVS